VIKESSKSDSTLDQTQEPLVGHRVPKQMRVGQSPIVESAALRLEMIQAGSSPHQ